MSEFQNFLLIQTKKSFQSDYIIEILAINTLRY